MATRFNTYFNSPQFAQAASNLSSLFAPPSAADEFNYERASGQRFQNDAIGQAWQAMTAAGATPEVQDRYGVAATLFGQGFNPTQTNRAVDIASADRRYNVDSRDATAITTQGMANAAGLAETAMTPLDEGERRPGLPGFSYGQLLSAAGLEMPDDYVDSEVGTEFGLPRPRTSDEVQALNLQNALRGNPDLATALAFNGLDTTNVVGPDGSPQIAFSGLAASGGAEPFVQTGSRAGIQERAYVTPEGEVLRGYFDPNTGQTTLPDGSPLPANATPADVTGGRDDVGASTTNRVDRQYMATQDALNVANTLMRELEANPGAAGIAGATQRFFQNTIQTIDEVSQAFGGQTPSVEDLYRAGFMDDETFGQYFNPALPRIELLKNQLVWAYASANQADGRVSNQQMERAEAALGLRGIAANNAAIGAAVAEVVRQLEGRADSLGRLASPEVVRQYNPAEPAGGEQPVTRLRFNPETGQLEPVAQ